ncbi:MAG: SRPBCC domain-containing protein [Bacteroidota bacterium]|nr:SRPBCC domain-containing protein [Bacteroidota bacterium]MDP4218756.1 SRPBCC domain-containing protein [Bacteroidota bacterium]MDP4245350.1 SRPBCC domain-containing protein [Bacteroidota bacterium]MDP4252627.1 SRPBCC domain-containing protein [Bacteroidota bacterium]MDP4258492.1 SRPBCC domain-containing protein [Bacteroidota bacterium]
MNLIQTIQFQGITPERLYTAYLNSVEHGHMTTSGAGEDHTTWFRPGKGNVGDAEVGDELRCWGFKDGQGEQVYNLKATILELVPNQLIVQTWKNLPFTLATNKELVTALPSTLVLRFRKTAFGSEIHMAHINVPDYEVFIEQTGEKDALGNIINTHWGLQYWEPMQKYFGCNPK